MANIKSAKKRARTSERAKLQNKGFKSALKTRIKTFETLALEGDLEQAEVAFKDASSYLDKMASKGIVHKNAAARKKSRLAKKLKQKVEQEPAV